MNCNCCGDKFIENGDICRIEGKCYCLNCVERVDIDRLIIDGNFNKEYSAWDAEFFSNEKEMLEYDAE